MEEGIYDDEITDLPQEDEEFECGLWEWQARGEPVER